MRFIIILEMEPSPYRVIDRVTHLGWLSRLVHLIVMAFTLSMASIFAAGAQTSTALPPLNVAAAGPLAEARSLMNGGDFEAAADRLSVYLKSEPASAAGHRLLAYSYLRLGEPKLSLEEYTRAAAIERPDSIDLRNVAKAYVLAGDMTSAAHWARVALEMDKRDPEGWYELGRIHYTTQHFQDAAECFKQTLLLLPRSVKAENNLGLAYEGMNRGEDAVVAYRQAIEWQRSDPRRSEQPLLNLGVILGHQGKLDEAYTLLSDAISIAPRDPHIREEFGHLCLQMNKTEEAKQQLEQAISLDPKKASAHFLLGRAYHLQGDEAKSKAEFALAATLSNIKTDKD